MRLVSSIRNRLWNGFRALRHANYRRLWIGSLLSNTGTFMQVVAQGWLVLQLTNSPFMLGLVGFCTVIPSTLLTPLGGVAADRWDRRRILLVTQLAMTISAIALAVLIWTHSITVGTLIVLSVISGVALAFNNPAYQALLLELVGREDLSNAIALGSVAFNTCRVLGPAVGAVILATTGIGWCYFLNGLSFLAVIVALMRMKNLPARQIPAHEPILANLRFALRYVLDRPTMKTLLLLTGAYGLLAFPQLQLLPVFARDVLGIGAGGLGMLLACFGAGGVVSSLVLAMMGEVPWRGRLYIACATGLGVLLVMFGLSQSPGVSFVLMTAVGITHVQTMVNNNTMLQRLMPDELRGRLIALFFLSFQGTLPLGNLLAGTLAEHLGAPRAVMILGIAFSSCVLFAMLRVPKLRQAF